MDVRNDDVHIYRSTRQYDKFKLVDPNRDIRDFHVKKIIANIQKQNLLMLVPIIVNEYGDVLDGQHRLAAARFLCVPIYYILEPGIDNESMVNLNINNMNWKNADFLKHYRNSGNIDYDQLAGMAKKLGWSPSAMLFWLGEARRKQEKFKSGDFEWSPTQELLVAMHSTKLLLDAMEENDMYRASTYRNQKPFHMACKLFFMSKAAIDNHFIKKIREGGKKLRHQSGTKDYLENMIDIYNHRRQVGRLTLFDDRGKFTIRILETL